MKTKKIEFNVFIYNVQDSYNPSIGDRASNENEKLVAAIRIFMNFMKKLCKKHTFKRNIAYTLWKEAFEKATEKGKNQTNRVSNLFRSLEYLFVVFPSSSKIRGVEGKLELPCGKEV